MPTIVQRAAQPYVAVRDSVPMDAIHIFAQRLSEVFDWLGAHSIAPAGPPFFRYNVVDMRQPLEMEAGVPVAASVQGDGGIVADVLPPGRYVTTTHLGHPDELEQATANLLEWGAQQGLSWDSDGTRWGCRLEIYHSDPDVEPDMNKWETDLVFRLAD